MNDLVTVAADQEEPTIWKPSDVLSPERFDFLWRLAERVASSSMVPDSLCTEGNKENKKPLARDTVVANVFFVAEIADRWQMPFVALLQCASMVHGKLGFEGKVIAAVLKARYGIDLEYAWEGTGVARKITVTGKKRNGRVLTIEGTVSQWKTATWPVEDYDKRLAYRGAREWARVHEPMAILGILGDDEPEEFEARARAATLVNDPTKSLGPRYGGAAAIEGKTVDKSKGFDPSHTQKALPSGSGQLPMDVGGEKAKEVVDQSTGEITTVAGQEKTQESGSGQQAAETDDAGDHGPTVVSAENRTLMRDYSKGLSRGQSKASLEALDKEFWSDHTPPTDEIGLEERKAIYRLHLHRVSKKITAEEFSSGVAEILGAE